MDYSKLKRRYAIAMGTMMADAIEHAETVEGLRREIETLKGKASDANAILPPVDGGDHADAASGAAPADPAVDQRTQKSPRNHRARV